MKSVTSSALAFTLLGLALPARAAVFINEIHYDNAGTDTGEAIEIAGPAGTDLTGWSLVLYNGNGGAPYSTVLLSGVIPNQQAGFGTAFVGYPSNGIQNGAPDGVALVDALSSVVQFLSYEGSFTAVGGPADGLTSVDIGVSEPGDGPVGESLQLTGTGSSSGEFAWAASMAATFGAVNTGQTFTGGPPADPVVNELVANHAGTDTHEFVEVAGEASTDYSAFSVLQIEGDGTAQGTIDGVFTVGVTDAAGLWTSGFLGNTLENGSLTLLLVKDFSGAVGDDVDADNDGAVDTPFWGALVDSVAISDGGADDGLYSPVVLAPGFGADPFTPGGASRIPDRLDTDTAADWLRNDFDGAGLPGFTGTPVPGEAFNTPGAANAAVPTPPPSLVVNEIDYDQPGTDAAEFVEIKNTGSSPADLDPIALVLVNGNGGTVYQTIDLPAVTLGPGEYFVVCANAAATINCDLDVSPDTNLIQNGAPDAVALVSGDTILDAVSYEGDTAAPYTEGSGAGLEDDPAAAFLGLSRFPDGTDSDQNDADLSPRCITPGAANGSAATGCSEPVRSALVINEIDYDQPGPDGAEFVELKNVSGATVDLGAYELRLVNGSGGGAAVYRTIDLPATPLAAGDYYVICGSSINVAECDLVASPASDLIQNGAPDAVGLVLDGAVVDAVSYEGDAGAPYTEGSGAGLEDSGLAGQDFKGISRFPDGADTDVNNLDLSARCITPGGPNTAFVGNCSPTGPVFEIYEIQGAGAASPFVGGIVTSQDNIVTALAADGFFIQTPDARADASIDTSNGIFVFTGGPAPVAPGDQVDVTATVVEFFGFTELGGSPRVSIDSSGNPLPAATVFDASVPSPDPVAPSCAIEFECYEGMRIRIDGGTVTGPNQRFGTDPVAEVHVVAGPARAFREPGILYPGLPGLPVWDGNPEVFELDPDRLGLPNQPIPAGSRFDAEGVLGFEFGGYELWPTSLGVTPAPLPRAVASRQPGEFSVGSLNMLRFFDDVDDPPSVNFEGGIRDDAVVSTGEFARRRAKFVRYILEVLDAPDILALQEVEKLENLETLAADILAADPALGYHAYLVEGNDIGTIDVGFLVRDTVQVDAVTQLGLTETYLNPLNNQLELLHDRPPLLLEGRYAGDGADFAISAIAVHNRSLGGIEDPVQGPRVRQKRLEQAQSIAQKVQDLQTANPGVHLVVLGDFNAFEFSDGYVDAVGQIAGAFDPAESERPGPDLVDPNLTILTADLPAAERYSFNFAGSAQAIDHALTSSRLGPLVRGVEYGRGNADAAVDLVNDGTTPLRSADHDGLVLRIFADSDRDGVADSDDRCSATVVPEGVPTHALGTNRYALVDGDRIFDTTAPPGGGRGPGEVFSLDDTAGCSCEQIIAKRGLGQGHRKFGCSVGAMRDWVESIEP